MGSETVSIGLNAVLVGGTTLKPAASGMTVDGALVSLGSSGLVVGSQTKTVVFAANSLTAVLFSMTVGTVTITAGAGSLIASLMDIRSGLVARVLQWLMVH